MRWESALIKRTIDGNGGRLRQQASIVTDVLSFAIWSTWLDKRTHDTLPLRNEANQLASASKRHKLSTRHTFHNNGHAPSSTMPFLYCPLASLCARSRVEKLPKMFFYFFFFKYDFCFLNVAHDQTDAVDVLPMFLLRQHPLSDLPTLKSRKTWKLLTLQIGILHFERRLRKSDAATRNLQQFLQSASFSPSADAQEWKTLKKKKCTFAYFFFFRPSIGSRHNTVAKVAADFRAPNLQSCAIHRPTRPICDANNPITILNMHNSFKYRNARLKKAPCASSNRSIERRQ